MWKPTTNNTKEDEFETQNFKCEERSCLETRDVDVQPIASRRFYPSGSGRLSNDVQEAFECQINCTNTSLENMIPAVTELFASTAPPEAKIRDKVSDLLQDYSDGICLANFARAFEKKFGGSIDDHWLGFGTVYELLISMKDIVELQDLPGGDLLVKGKFGLSKSPGILLVFVQSLVVA